MSVETSQKVTASQLKRSAFLYVRQSTPARFWSIPRVPPANMRSGNAPSPSAGRMIKSSP